MPSIFNFVLFLLLNIEHSYQFKSTLKKQYIKSQYNLSFVLHLKRPGSLKKPSKPQFCASQSEYSVNLKFICKRNGHRIKHL